MKLFLLCLFLPLFVLAQFQDSSVYISNPSIAVTPSGGTFNVTLQSSGATNIGTISNTAFGASQVGTWNINSILNPVAVTLATVPTHPVTQSGAWSTGRTWSLASSTDSTTVTGSVSVSNTVPVTGTFFQATQPVSQSGTWNINSILNPVAVTGTFFQATQPVSIASSVAVTGPLTDTQLRATAIPVSLSSTTISNFPATQAVTGAFYQATQPVSLTSLPAFASTPTVNLGTLNGVALDTSVNSLLKPSSTLAAVTSITNPISIAGTVPVSGTFFQATQPVSIAGTVTTTGGLTDTQLRASAVPVSLTSTTISNFPATQAISAASLPLPTGAATSANQTTANSSLSTIATNTPALGQALAAASSPVVLPAAQITALTPPAAITGYNLETTQSAINTKIPSNLTVSATRLLVDGSGVTQPVSGTFFQATQPVSIAGTVTTTGGLTDTQLRATAVPVTANAGTNLNTSLLALDSTVAKDSSLGTLNTSINTLLKPASTLAAVTSITNPISIAGTVPVSGSLGRSWSLASSTDSTTVVVSGTPNVNITNASVPVTGTFFQATQPISATSLPLPTGAATAANQSTTNASIASIDTKTPALGQALAASSVPIVLTASQISTLTPLSSVSITGTVPVTGTFFQSTQPVSIATLPSLATGVNAIGSITNTSFGISGTLPAFASIPTFNLGTLNGAALDTSVNSLLKPASTLAAVTTVGSVTSITNPVAVTGTFFQGTQPVSIATLPLATNAATDRTTAAAPYSNRLSDGTDFLATFDMDNTAGVSKNLGVTLRTLTNGTPVEFGTVSNPFRIDPTGSTIQPVNGTVTSNAGTNLNTSALNLETTQSAFSAKFPATAALADATATPTITKYQSFMTSYNGTTWDLVRSAVKGTQGAFALMTQDYKDSGRVSKNYSATFTAATTEALVTLTPISDGTASGTATTFAITATKKFRIQSLCVTTRNAGAAGQGVVVQLRMTASGAVSATSSLVGTASAGTSLAVANITGQGCASIPDGLELSGTQQFGISQVGTATANNTVVLTGYEY